MKYVAVFLLALAAVAFAADKKECFEHNFTMLNGLVVDCHKFYNGTMDKDTKAVYCCEDEGSAPHLQSIQIDEGTAMFVCECEAQ
ncbi:hypothetical protein PoB_006355600 [Plakobranchus ocellatus]|uniref:Plethodontid modulating factor n=1 Tax=Plakobranchus ocellatus TaxID=259542 RepID=A0AAV4CZ88_9GAST|nr:hypothetical protein PoB_006355600 [Plakobranchus ocellatus]